MRSATPFEIFRAIVSFNTIDVIYLWATASHECQSNKAMNLKCFWLAFATQANSRISALVYLQSQQLSLEPAP